MADDDGPSGVGPWLWVGLAVLVLLVAGAAVVAWPKLPTASPPTASATTTAPPSEVSSVPLRPGLEPPREGEWPKVWPKFGQNGTHLVALERLGEVRLPVTWSCRLGETAADFTKYSCGAPIGGDEDIGGEVILRDCPSPCDVIRHSEMRATEEAWGLQWRFAGPNVTIAETLKLNGEADRYGLVLIAYYSSVRGDQPDRQIVLRMAAPGPWVDVIRRVANAFRDTAKF